MGFYGRSNRMLIEQEILKGELRDCQIVECDLSGLAAGPSLWNEVELRDLHANDIRFEGTRIAKSFFYRSSFMRARFTDTAIRTATLDGLTLIRSRWQGCSVSESIFKNLCLQRAEFLGCRISGSTFADFEALDAAIENTVIAHSGFSISYGSGMNGFSGGTIRNCLFYNCRFEGFPLRGAALDSCAFIYCSGEIGDDMDCSNVAGLGLRGGRISPMPIKSRNEASGLLARFI
ncbi:pentapeptide repeat-containing protein [Breznakiella homolactica]|uniref:Pentapeptide repeat-containing protein n=1 Tax=Breznakiella homolactica TaxID=2798577 RepID=A0A7T7XMB1_9SPIR|nr:pentapeptide repeat-containing protein [Breznakiella homolactica]QQO09001.1 pentapeptide repeat-containing protein [Breznakiella homolactica]